VSGLYMPPCLQASDSSDRRFRYAEHFSDQRIWNTFASSDHDNLFGSQFGEMLVFSSGWMEKAKTIGMQNILAARYILKIVSSIIRRLTVDMVHFFTGGTRADECSGNQAMDFALQVFAFASKIHGQMSALSCAWLKYLANVSGLPCTNTFHSAVIGHLVPSFTVSDGSPNLLLV